MPAIGNLPFSQLGPYDILGELGQGSMATLYLGRRRGMGGFERLFAIKVMHEHLGRKPAFVEMLLNEARIAARIQHPNVVPTYELDVDQGRHFVVMDYISGETFAALLRATWSAGRPLPIPTTLHIVSRVCEGLHAAHELIAPDGSSLGVVHRDLAPQNVMIGYDGSVRVMDFGIAKAMDTISQTRPGVLKGTVAYMAPEQVRCEPLDRRVDVFALGVVLWESTVGLRLFRHENDIGTAARILRMEVPKPSSIVEGYPPALEQVVLRALERTPEARYPDTRTLGDELEAVLTGLGETITPSRLADFMGQCFEDKRAARKEMERKARDPGVSGLEIPQDGGSIGLTALQPAQAVDIDEAFDKLDQARVPTMVVRERDLTPAPEVEVQTPGEAEAVAKDREPTRKVAWASVVPAESAQAPRPDFDDSDTLDADMAAAIARPRLWPLGLGLGLGLGALAVFWPQEHGERTLGGPVAIVATPPQGATTVTATRAAVDEAEPEAPTRTATRAAVVRIALDVRPAEADVRLDGAPPQSNPFELPRGDDFHVLEVSAPGHEPLRRVIVADEDQTVQVELQKTAVDKPARKPRRARSRPKKRAPKASTEQPLLFGGDDL